jgi:hypothetical protein
MNTVGLQYQNFLFPSDKTVKTAGTLFKIVSMKPVSEHSEHL